MEIKTIFNRDSDNIPKITEYKVIENLTTKLDNFKSDFNQEIINEIVLWKVNRYAELDSFTLDILNKIQNNETELNLNLTSDVLKKLLETKGIRLAMASTILRFKNPNIYQIIDQRVYRYIYGEVFNDESNNIEKQSKLYFDYLVKLREICIQFKIKFEESDRILYLMDKTDNKDYHLKESKNLKPTTNN